MRYDIYIYIYIYVIKLLKFKLQICYTEITNLSQFTINVPKIPPSTSVHFSTRVRRSRVVRLSRSSRFFMQLATSKMRESN